MNSAYSGMKGIVFIQWRNSWHVEIFLQLKWSWHRAKHSLSLLRLKRRSNNTTGITSGTGTSYTIPRHLSSHPVFSEVRVTRSLVLCVWFVDRCLSFCLCFFSPLCCLSFIVLRIPITPLVSSNAPYECIVWLKRTASIPRSSKLETSSLTIIPLMSYRLQLNPLTADNDGHHLVHIRGSCKVTLTGNDFS